MLFLSLLLQAMEVTACFVYILATADESQLIYLSA